MDALGTLESPLTHDYMVWLLQDRFFSEVTRHHAVNGLAPVGLENEPVRNFVYLDAAYYNLVSARKRLGVIQSVPVPVTPERPPPPSLGRRLWKAVRQRLG